MRQYQQLHSQVVQQVADRYFEARQRFLEGLARFPKGKESTQVVLPRLPSVRLENTESEGDQDEEQEEQEEGNNVKTVKPRDLQRYCS